MSQCSKMSTLLAILKVSQWVGEPLVLGKKQKRRLDRKQRTGLPSMQSSLFFLCAVFFFGWARSCFQVCWWCGWWSSWSWWSWWPWWSWCSWLSMMIMVIMVIICDDGGDAAGAGAGAGACLTDFDASSGGGDGVAILDGDDNCDHYYAGLGWGHGCDHQVWFDSRLDGWPICPGWLFIQHAQVCMNWTQIISHMLGMFWTHRLAWKCKCFHVLFSWWAAFVLMDTWYLTTKCLHPCSHQWHCLWWSWKVYSKYDY